MSKTHDSEKVEIIEWSRFLEFVAPNHPCIVGNVLSQRASSTWTLATPEINRYCETCKGARVFDCRKDSSGWMSASAVESHRLIYECRNCKEFKRHIAFVVVLCPPEPGQSATAEAIKLGEYPAFGSPVPARVRELAGVDGALLVQGWRAEESGFGLGAFAYYRRVVEDSKNRILDEVVRVMKREAAPTADIAVIERAKEEVQFQKALETAARVIPRSLYLSGHNPLNVLHTVLSEHIHARSDQECLASAAAIRLVLVELCERIRHVLRDRAELDQAVSKLLESNREATERKKQK